MRNGFFVYTHGQIINKRVNGMITSATQMEWNDLPKEKKKKKKKNNNNKKLSSKICTTCSSSSKKKKCMQK